MGVEAQVPGNVWKLAVAEGERVAAGDAIVVLESMKMEVPLVAPTAGRVRELRVAEGPSVQGGDVAAVIEAVPAS